MLTTLLLSHPRVARELLHSIILVWSGASGLRLSALCLQKCVVCCSQFLFSVVGSGRFEVCIVSKCDRLFQFLALAAAQTVGF